MNRYLVSMLALITIIGCNTTKELGASASKPNQMDYSGKRELIDYLRATAGVEIRGSGSNVLVLVRGVKSMNTDNNPLYIVDGINMGRSYAQAASAANSFEIESVNVVTPPRAGKYGSQGQNGVIEVTLKKSN